MRIKVTLSRSLFYLSLFLIVSLPIAAQVSEQEKKEKEAERRQQLERKTYALVEEIAGGALALKLPENRSYLLVAAADLLWQHDAPAARNLFWDALNTLNLMNSSVGSASDAQAGKGAKPSARDKQRTLNEYQVVFSLRQQLLLRVARRDPQLALDMLRSSRQTPAEVPAEWIRKGYVLPDDSQLEQQIAGEVAARDPQKALQLARETLGKGFSYELIDLLFRLNLKDPELATKFAGDIVDKLRARNIATDPQGANIAFSLLALSRAPAEQPAALNATAAVNRRLKLAPELRRELVELITNAALTESANSRLLFDLGELMPEIREFVPEREALVQKKLAAFRQTLNQDQRTSLEYSALIRNGTPEEMLKLSQTAADDNREAMQQEAIMTAVMRGRAESLREYVNFEINDKTRRKSLLDALDAEQINFASDRGDTEELQKLLPKIRRQEARALAMTGIAIALEKKGKHDEALSVLDQAQTLIKTDFDSDTQTNALLALVGAYALVEPAKAFGIIERTIDRANDEMAKALLLDKIVRSGILKKGEIRLQNSGVMPIDFAVFKYGKSVAALANADFDRTRAAADRFEPNELRLMARLLLAQALLGHDDQGLPLK